MSLKEIKARIASVSSTRKITSAMKMVSTVKLRKAQQNALAATPYMNQLNGIMKSLMSVPEIGSHPLLEKREGGKTIIVAFASDTSLCGGFNAAMIRHIAQLISSTDFYGLSSDKIVFPIGQKMLDAVQKMSVESNGKYTELISKRDFESAALLSDDLVNAFLSGKVNRVILSYDHFISTGTQHIVDEQLLPIDIDMESLLDGKGSNSSTSSSESTAMPLTDYILEPSASELLDTLLPKVMRMKVFTAVLESFASEEASRVVAMQLATENADHLLGSLTLQYNKQRQQAITNEILDLASGASTL